MVSISSQYLICYYFSICCTKMHQYLNVTHKKPNICELDIILTHSSKGFDDTFIEGAIHSPRTAYVFTN